MDTNLPRSAPGFEYLSRPLTWVIAFIGCLLPVAATGQTYEVLYNFEPRPPASSYAALIQDASGNLYGTTSQGGSGSGTLFKLETGGTLTIIHSFDYLDGAVPYAGLIQDESGNLYGTTSTGGGPDANYYGTVFKLDPSGTFTTLHAFTPFEQGSNLRGPLIFDAAGNLYGTSAYGGLFHYGTIFKIDPTGLFVPVHTFSLGDGRYPMAGLIADEMGNFYGTASDAGENGWYGTIFRLNPSSGSFTKLHDFNGIDGSHPKCSLIRDAFGNLYGTTSEGGISNLGTVFRLDTSGVLTTLHEFNGLDGANPQAALIRDDAGNFYGTTANGGENGLGTIFQLDNLGSLTTLHSFEGSDGSNPSAPLIRDSLGNLFGTTAFGGAVSRGTVFQLDPSGTLTTLHNFNGPDPAFSGAGLSLDSSGNLYGTSTQGGWNDLGTVFELDASGALTALHSFSGSDGARPWASLLVDSAGTLYGTTKSGGQADLGTIFQVDSYGALTTLHEFGGFDGGGPRSSLIRDDSGTFYGTTGNTVFDLDLTGELTTLHSFGAGVGTALTRDRFGNLYGTTERVIFYTNGIVFKLDTEGTLTTLHEFVGPEGSDPQAPLVQDSTGNLYGTTAGGGAYERGTIFQLDASGTLTTLHSFDGSDGELPRGGLVRDGSGNLYGTTQGTIFELDTSNKLITLHRLVDPEEGVLPNGGLIRDSAGNLYGTTYRGGAGRTGVIFRLTALTVSDISPSSGPPSGGTPVTLSGTGFPEGANVTIGGTDTADVVVVSPTEIQASTPTLSPGTLNDVTVLGQGDAEATLVKVFFADFLDVPLTDPFHDYVEKIVRKGITAGCGAGDYCPADAVTRAQMAVFLLKSKHGSAYVPPACAGVFADVPCPSIFADWIERLAAEEITAGCGGASYCPTNPVTRAQTAVFLLKAKHGSDYGPPKCIGVFGDVACPSLFADWIEQFAAELITGGCGGGNYCPDKPNTRAQMSAFLVKAFQM